MSGFTRYVCDQPTVSCPSEPPETAKKCQLYRGTPKTITDVRGCSFTYCDFGDAPVDQEPEFFSSKSCPTTEQLEKFSKQCQSQGLDTMIEQGVTSGCNYARCVAQSTQSYDCKAPPLEEKRSLEASCNSRSGKLVESFDSTGCSAFQCVLPSEVQGVCVDVPEKAYQACASSGGELIVKLDDQGCVVFSECSSFGEKTSEFKEVGAMPSDEEVLGIVLKLETLDTELNSLKEKSQSLSDYWSGAGNASNAERFEKVVGMFSSAQRKIDDIRETLRAPDRTKKTVYEALQGLQDIKRILQDALYLLLNAPAETTSRIGGSCGSDFDCFNKALRLCEKATITKQEGDKTFDASIEGISDAKCSLRVNATIDGKRYSMSCALKDFSNGSLETKSFESECTGSLVEQLRQFNPKSEGYGSASSIPAGCKEVKDESTGQTYVACPAYTQSRLYTPLSGATGALVLGKKWRD